MYECVCLVCLRACVFMCVVCVHVCVHVRLACLPLGQCWEHRGGSGSLAGWGASQVRRKASWGAVGSSEIRFRLKGWWGLGMRWESSTAAPELPPTRGEGGASGHTSSHPSCYHTGPLRVALQRSPGLFTVCLDSHLGGRPPGSPPARLPSRLSTSVAG